RRDAAQHWQYHLVAVQRLSADLRYSADLPPAIALYAWLSGVAWRICHLTWQRHHISAFAHGSEDAGHLQCLGDNGTRQDPLQHGGGTYPDRSAEPCVTTGADNDTKSATHSHTATGAYIHSDTCQHGDTTANRDPNAIPR